MSRTKSRSHRVTVAQDRGYVHLQLQTTVSRRSCWNSAHQAAALARSQPPAAQCRRRSRSSRAQDGTESTRKSSLVTGLQQDKLQRHEVKLLQLASPNHKQSQGKAGRPCKPTSTPGRRRRGRSREQQGTGGASCKQQQL